MSSKRIKLIEENVEYLCDLGAGEVGTHKTSRTQMLQDGLDCNKSKDFCSLKGTMTKVISE